MALINLIRELFPMYYWSAGFIAMLLVAVIAGLILYTITKWTPWIMASGAALLYLIPFLLHFRV
jgi:uncharacterized membrane-anchored protein